MLKVNIMNVITASCISSKLIMKKRELHLKFAEKFLTDIFVANHYQIYHSLYVIVSETVACR